MYGYILNSREIDKENYGFQNAPNKLLYINNCSNPKNVFKKCLIFWRVLLGFIIDIELVYLCFYITYLYSVQTKYLNISKVS